MGAFLHTSRSIDDRYLKLVVSAYDCRESRSSQIRVAQRWSKGIAKAERSYRGIIIWRDH